MQRIRREGVIVSLYRYYLTGLQLSEISLKLNIVKKYANYLLSYWILSWNSSNLWSFVCCDLFQQYVVAHLHHSSLWLLCAPWQQLCPMSVPKMNSVQFSFFMQHQLRTKVISGHGTKTFTCSLKHHLLKTSYLMKPAGCVQSSFCCNLLFWAAYWQGKGKTLLTGSSSRTRLRRTDHLQGSVQRKEIFKDK